MNINEIDTLERAADRLVSLLSTEEKLALAESSSFSPLIKGGAELIAFVLRHFRLHDATARPLLKHIHEHPTGQVTNMDFMAEAADPMLAARLIVERAREKYGRKPPRTERLAQMESNGIRGLVPSYIR